jgi:hypothetical protein
MPTIALVMLVYLALAVYFVLLNAAGSAQEPLYRPVCTIGI